MCAPFAKHRAYNPTCIHYFLTLKDSSNLGLFIVVDFELLGEIMIVFKKLF